MKSSYSFLIKPITIIIDLTIINGVIFLAWNEGLSSKYFLIYLSLVWIFISYSTKFYTIKRTTSVIKILSLLISQIFLYSLAFFAFFAIFEEGVVVDNQFLVHTTIIGLIFVNKFFTFYVLKIYRKLGRNYRRVVVIGDDDVSRRIIRFFKTEENFGYRYLGFYSNKKSNRNSYLGTISQIHEILNFDELVDEIYCSPSVMGEEKRKELIWFSKSNNIKFKILSKPNDIYSKNLSLEYYETIPVYSVEELPFEREEIRFVKRAFDIIFSLAVIIILLSWTYPILWIIIKLDSKGPVIFKQKREGLNGSNFSCYKFRSMIMNDESDEKSAQKGDDRITRFGRVLRKTSLDEFPQFFNVLIGDMSVVGPRPHMTKQSKGFEIKIDNYYKRNAIKPGITGLAQVSGYRGEVKKKSDIENRIRLDIFYIKKWSFLLDLKIILSTVINLFKGEEKAY